MRRTFTIHVFERRLVLGVSMFESNIDPRRAKAQVKAAVLDQLTLGEWLMSWYRREKAWWSLRDNRELLQQLYRDLADGRIHVREEPKPRTLASRSPSGASSRPPRPLPELVVEPIEASDKSLLISSCPALLPRDGVLRYSYLLRGLEGQAVAVRLRSEDGQLLHQRDLGLDETRDGPHGGEWSGEITEGPRAGECVHPRDGNCTLELVHDDSYRDAAAFRVSCLRRHTVDFEDVLFEATQPRAVAAAGRQRAACIAWRCAELGCQRHGSPWCAGLAADPRVGAPELWLGLRSGQRRRCRGLTVEAGAATLCQALVRSW